MPNSGNKTGTQEKKERCERDRAKVEIGNHMPIFGNKNQTQEKKEREKNAKKTNKQNKTKKQ